MKKFQITFTTEDPAPEYTRVTRKAKTIAELIEVLKFYEPIAADALKVAKKMTDQDLKDFKRDVVLAARKHDKKWIDEFNRRFGVLVMPSKMLMSSMLALQHGALWGCAFIRYEEFTQK